MRYICKLNNIEDLKESGYVILGEGEPIINNVEKIMIEENISRAELSAKTGLCRQYISNVVNCRLVPRITGCLKIAKVLKRPVEEVFELTEESWIKTATIGKDVVLYLDIYNMEIISNDIRKERVKKEDLEYVIITENKCISRKQYELIEEEFLKLKKSDNRRLSFEDRQECLKELGNIYTERFKKLGEIPKRL